MLEIIEGNDQKEAETIGRVEMKGPEALSGF